MNELLLCKHTLAEKPYFISENSIYIYSIEELSYYLSYYIDTVEKDFFSKELIKWLEEECMEKELGKKLEKLMSEDASLKELYREVFQSNNFFNEKKQESIIEHLKLLEKMSPFQKKKYKGDKFLFGKQYEACVLSYRSLLYDDGFKDISPLEQGKIWHNLGYSYAKLMMYDCAWKCFEQAYRLGGYRESLREGEYAKLCLKNLNCKDEVYDDSFQYLLNSVCNNEDQEKTFDDLEQWIKDYKEYR